ncbi:MAG: zinc-binding dehydrogenase [Acidimicrobiia bacterium]|nr:zinc-binding dehydrogenase [Acidimicrobiia bacterium]
MTRTMRAARFHGVGEGVRVEEVPYPEPGPGEVVVAVAACGICGSDVHFLEDVPVPGPLPMTLGHEAAGIVEALGEGVEGWTPGDRVALSLDGGCGTCRTCRAGSPNACLSLVVPGLHCDGAFAEALRVPAGGLVRVPDEVSLSSAAVATDCVATPFHALRCRGGLREGETVAVVGAGGLGSAAIALAGALGAGRVVAVDRSEAALERAKRAGATTVLATPGEDPVPAVHEATDGGADLVVECVGTPETVSVGLRSLVQGGRLVAVGVGMQPPPIDYPQALFSLWELSVIGAFASHREDLEEVLALQAEGRIDIESWISHRVPLDGVVEGLEMLRTKRGDPQRVVMTTALADT